MSRMSRAWWLAVAGVAVCLAVPRAQTPAVTFNRDVAPILYKNCAACHRPGELAPMSLTTFKDARPWARALKTAVVTRSMPPWGADPKFGEFANDPRLSEKDMATIVAWVDGGAIEGNATRSAAAAAVHRWLAHRHA